MGGAPGRAIHQTFGLTAPGRVAPTASDASRRYGLTLANFYRFNAEWAADLDLSFTTHTGDTVTLGSLVEGDIPTLLTLNYYTCETLCSLQLNAVLDGLKALDWVPGDQFRVITVSIDPKEDAALARSKRDSYIEALGKGDVEWHFLTGSSAAIESLVVARSKAPRPV